MVIPEGEMPACVEVHKRAATSADLETYSLVNVIPGQVTAIHRGLLNMGLRVRVGERTDLRVRWPLGSAARADLTPRVSVKAVIPADAIHLESGYFRLGTRRWNRWIGRIVFVDTSKERQVISVKLHNDQVTWKCCGSMTGSTWVPRVWDTVNIVIDPTKIRLDGDLRQEVVPTVSRDMETIDPFLDARVWMGAHVTEIGEAPEGKVLSLLIGTARVSVFIGWEDDSFGRWSSGMRLDIHVGRYDAWLRPAGSGHALILCGLLYLDSHSLTVTR